jgi:3-oxoacyl-[acyl-carrier-protein] synthase II
MRFGFRGPSHLVSTGCTSSSDALGYAFRQIRYGDATTILAGGADAPIALQPVAGQVQDRSRAKAKILTRRLV